MENQYSSFIRLTRFVALCFLFFVTSVNVNGQSKIDFVVDDIPSDDTKFVGIRGNIAPLSWDQSIPLEKVEDKYRVSIVFEEAEKDIEFKFVRYNDDTSPTWEETPNRTFKLLPGETLTSINSWNREQPIDVSSLSKISSADLLKDFELIKTMVLDIHPGTYRYNNKEEIEQSLAELKSTFGQDLTYGQAYLAISKVTAQLKCDHTKAGFNNQNRTMNAVLHGQKNKLPFTFKWVDDLMVVMENASNNDLLQRGSIIHSINGIPVEDIQRKLMPLVGADGATDGNRTYKLEVEGYDFRYNAFDIFFPLVFDLDTHVQLDVEVNSKIGRTKLRVALLSLEERKESLFSKYEDFPKTRDDMWNFEVLNDSLAMLQLNSFGLNGWKSMTLDYKLYFKEVFQRLNDESIPHLIIDIRKNTGGSDEIAVELFEYLVKDPFQFEREGRTRYLDFPELLKPHIKTWGDNPWYYNLDPKDKNPTDGYYIFKENFKSNKKSSKKKIYQGQSYLFTSHANTSLAFYTAYRFKHQQLGPLIGQETGGNLNDINGGQILFLELPNSGIEIDFPVMGGFATKPQTDKGVSPDIEIKYGLKDIVDKRDLELEAVRKIINSR